VSPPPPPDVDGDRPEVAERYAQRHRELEAATHSVISAAPDAGRALALAGDMLRRLDAMGDKARDVAIALDRIEAQAAHAYVESIDAAAEHKKLAGGLDEAFEALLEDGEERVLFVHAAESALFARDALESVRMAMTHHRLDTSKLEGKLQQIDQSLVKRARSLVGINAMRRREMAALDATERAGAWWFSARSQCDFLVSLYRLQDTEQRVDVTQKHNAAHLAVCEDCQHDVEAASHAYTPKHIAASSLWRREQGVATPTEIAFMDSHAAACKDCKRSLDALSVSTDD
jgi:hypothetical protein